VHRRVVHGRVKEIGPRIEALRKAHARQHALALAREPLDAPERWTVLKAEGVQLSVRLVSGQSAREGSVEHGSIRSARGEPHTRRRVGAPWAVRRIGATAHLCPPFESTGQPRLDSIESPLRQDECPAKLDIEQLQRLVRTHQPEELGIAAPLWTRRAVGELIRKEFDLALAERTVGRYLKRWGLAGDHPLTAPAYSAHKPPPRRKLGSACFERSQPMPSALDRQDMQGLIARGYKEHIASTFLLFRFRQNSIAEAKRWLAGLPVKDWRDVITVNMIGKRFYDETGVQYTSNNYKFVDPYIPGTYLNAKNIKFKANNYLNAALAGIGDGHNGGGPIWAIFDSDGVAREGWDPKPPNVDIDRGFFFSAEAIGELARKIVMKYQRVPMPPENLEASVARYNSFVDSGEDEDFGKPKPLFRIAKPPFYAAWATPVLHDTRAGLRINSKCQVLDMGGDVIPGLYCGGESAGGFSQHGLARATCQGFISGKNASIEPRRA